MYISYYSLFSNGNFSLIYTLILSDCVMDGGTFPGNISNYVWSELEIDWKEKSFHEYSNDNCGKWNMERELEPKSDVEDVIFSRKFPDENKSVKYNSMFCI